MNPILPPSSGPRARLIITEKLRQGFCNNMILNGYIRIWPWILNKIWSLVLFSSRAGEHWTVSNDFENSKITFTEQVLHMIQQTNKQSFTQICTLIWFWWDSTYSTTVHPAYFSSFILHFKDTVSSAPFYCSICWDRTQRENGEHNDEIPQCEHANCFQETCMTNGKTCKKKINTRF